MKKFIATIREPRGNRTSLREIHAESEREAMKAAKRFGQVVSVKAESRLFPAKGMTPVQRQMFLSRLATMIQSRVGISESLQLMQHHFTGPPRATAATLQAHMEKGSTLDEAIEKASGGNFPSTVVALIKSGSKTGNTAQALKNAVAFEIEMSQTLKGAKGMIFSAAGGFLMSIATIVATKKYFAPMILEQSFAQGGGVDIGWAFTMATCVEVAMVIVGVVLFGLIGLGTVGKWISPVKSDSIILKIPVYKDLILARDNYSTVFGLSMLVSSGVPMAHALALTGDAAGRGKLQQDLQLASRAIQQGRPWSDQMTSFDALDRAALGTASDRTELSQSLKAIAEQYKHIYQTRIRMLAPISQFVAIAFIALAGAVLFSLCVLPILQVSAHGLG